MKYLYILFLAGILSACGDKKKNEIVSQNYSEYTWASFPVEVFASREIAAKKELEKELVDAMQFWEEKAGHSIFLYKGEWTGDRPYAGKGSAPNAILANVIMFLDPWEFRREVAANTIIHAVNKKIQHSLVFINPHLGFCTGDCLDADENPIRRPSLRKTLAHELGHFMGLDHTDDKQDIMYPLLQAGASLKEVRVNPKHLRRIRGTNFF